MEYHRPRLCILRCQLDSLQGSYPQHPSSAEKMYLEVGAETTDGDRDENASGRQVFSAAVVSIELEFGKV